MKRFVFLLLLAALAAALTACAPKVTAVSIPVVYGGRVENFTIQTEGIFNGKASVTLDKALEELKLPAAAKAAVYTSDGEIVKTEPQKVHLLADGSLIADTQKIAGASGIMLDYPDASVCTVAELAKKSLDENKPVMILYLDGFGYDSYEAALAQGLIPNLKALKCVKAASVFPTITPVNYAAMVTGKTPKQTGIADRNAHKISCASIFDEALAQGKKAAIIEGDEQIIQFSVDQQLNPDTDGDGTTDDEVMQSAMKELTNNDDILFIHFHGIDDLSHIYGPQTKPVMAQIAKIDAWAGQLMQGWKGNIVAIADHGQHNNGNKKNSGSHGTFTSQDIFVPLLTNMDK